ncbi:MAG: hypothetical protein WC005_06410 [Candidatus Nanopelagicales bacterium]
MSVERDCLVDEDKDEWLGRITGNNIDLARVELLLGIDPLQWWVLAVDVDFTDFRQESVTALAVPAQMTRNDLMRLHRLGRNIEVTAFTVVDDCAAADQTRGTMPAELPIRTAVDFLTYGFKHLEMRLHVGWADLPEDMLLEVTSSVSCKPAT